MSNILPGKWESDPDDGGGGGGVTNQTGAQGYINGGEKSSVSRESFGSDHDE